MMRLNTIARLVAAAAGAAFLFSSSATAGLTQTLGARNAADCTTQTNGYAGEFCVEDPGGALFTCLASASPCGSGQWQAVAGGGGGHAPSADQIRTGGVGNGEVTLNASTIEWDPAKSGTPVATLSSGGTLTAGRFESTADLSATGGNLLEFKKNDVELLVPAALSRELHVGKCPESGVPTHGTNLANFLCIRNEAQTGANVYSVLQQITRARLIERRIPFFDTAYGMDTDGQFTYDRTTALLTVSNPTTADSLNTSLLVGYNGWSGAGRDASDGVGMIVGVPRTDLTTGPAQTGIEIHILGETTGDPGSDVSHARGIGLSANSIEDDYIWELIAHREASFNYDGRLDLRDATFGAPAVTKARGIASGDAGWLTTGRFQSGTVDVNADGVGEACSARDSSMDRMGADLTCDGDADDAGEGAYGHFTGTTDCHATDASTGRVGADLTCDGDADDAGEGAYAHFTGASTSGPAIWVADGTACSTACTNSGADGCVDASLIVGATDSDCTATAGRRLCECN